MSGWGRRFWPSGRYSPFSAEVGGPPTVTDDDYHYLGPDDIVDPPSHRNDSYGFPRHNASRADSADPLAPDILVLKHRGTTYPLHFEAFAIAEGRLSVHDLRRVAAEKTKCDDPRRIKLLYKGRVLKDDTKACKEEGLKQNSELMCIVSESPTIGGSRSEIESDESITEDEGFENGGPRVDVDGTIIRSEPRKRKGHRGGKKRRGRGGDSGANSPPPPRDSGFLAAPDAGLPRARSRSPSQSRQQPSQAPPPPPPPAQPAPAAPTTAAGQLDQLERLFHTDFVPKCVQYTSNPPADPKTRDFEYKKLSETILTQIILKLDAVETAGDEALRARRKELVRETQQVLSGLDKVGKF